MDPKSDNPLRLFFNPFALWTNLALKTGEAMWASAHAATIRANTTPRVAVIPTAPLPTEAPPDVPVQERPAANPPRKARAPKRLASKAAGIKPTRAKLRSKAKAKRRARR